MQQENYKEITQYHDLCKDLGVDFVGLQGLNRWGHVSDKWWEENRLEDNPSVDLNILEEQITTFKKADNVSVGGNIEGLIRNK